MKPMVGNVILYALIHLNENEISIKKAEIFFFFWIRFELYTNVSVNVLHL